MATAVRPQRLVDGLRYHRNGLDPQAALAQDAIRAEDAQQFYERQDNALGASVGVFRKAVHLVVLLPLLALLAAGVVLLALGAVVCFSVALLAGFVFADRIAARIKNLATQALEAFNQQTRQTAKVAADSWTKLTAPVERTASTVRAFAADIRGDVQQVKDAFVTTANDITSVVANAIAFAGFPGWADAYIRRSSWFRALIQLLLLVVAIVVLRRLLTMSAIFAATCATVLCVVLAMLLRFCKIR